MKKTNITASWYAFFAILCIIAAGLIYRGIHTETPIIFSPKNVLESTWLAYKSAYLEKDTLRTMDLSRNSVTTSEGESYTMLRSVWMDDHETFDTSWKWTKDNLQFKQGNLFSWLFGKRADGTYGILTDQSGENSASDADTDIAVSLMFAYARWRDPAYLASAKSIIDAIWANEVILIQGKPYLAADNVERLYTKSIAVNPSYFEPYAYRMFASIDSNHDWKGLIDTSYSVLGASMSDPLDKTRSAKLPPDWVLIDRSTGAVTIGGRSGPQGSLDTNYSFDALRVPWRIALDWYWYQEPRAKTILNSFGFLQSEFSMKGALATTYSHDGVAASPFEESAAMYGGAIGSFMVTDPRAAKNLYDTKLISLYNTDADAWRTKLSYYDDNWAWFGIALYNHLLPNLWASVAH